MKTFSLTILLATASLSFSQIQEIKPPKEDKKVEDKVLKCRDMRFRMVVDCNGTVYYDEDKKAVMHAKSGKPYTGSCKVCHINGNLEMYLTYQGGMPVGQDTIWYENGQMQLVRSHAMDGSGKEEGTWKLYRADGSLKWEKSYVMGAEDGESRYYFPDTSIQKIETWSMGQMSGPKKEYYKGNVLKKEIMYLNGEWDGKYITYFENGMVASEQEFKMGKKEGLSRYYYEDGALFYEENHVNGCREGEIRRFYPTDKRQWTVENYKKNIRHGLFEEYYDNEKNTKKYSATYKKGILQEEHFYDEFGDETAPPEKPQNNFNAEEEEDPKWPANPSDEWLEERKVSRKEYLKLRKKYLKYKAKEEKKTQGPGTGVRC